MGVGPALCFGSQLFALSRVVSRVGRGDPAATDQPEIDLRAVDTEHLVSRRHAEVEVRAGVASVRDLGSTNGTFVNGERLPPQAVRELAEGDTVRFGHLSLLYTASATWPDDISAEWESRTLRADSVVVRALGGLVDEDQRNAPAEGPSRREMVERVQRVLSENLITMHFQPIVDLESYRVAGVESLARISAEPRRGPDKWFDEAFVVGLGIDLELLAITQALGQVELLPPGTYMSINVAPMTAVSERFLDLLRQYPRERIVVEVTEHAAVTDYDALLEALRDARAAGARLAIDDMGSGYANMKHILRLAPELIKLDVDLVRGLDQDGARRALASSLTSFGRQIGAKIIAEGVETESECRALTEIGVPLGQGYFLARPGPMPVPATISR